MSKGHSVVEMFCCPATDDSDLFLKNETFLSVDHLFDDRYDCCISLHAGGGHGEYAVSSWNCFDDSVFMDKIFVDVCLYRAGLFTNVQPTGLDDLLADIQILSE